VYIPLNILNITYLCRSCASGTLFTALQKNLFGLLQISSVPLRLVTVVTHCRCSTRSLIGSRRWSSFFSVISLFIPNVFKKTVHLRFIHCNFNSPVNIIEPRLQPTFFITWNFRAEFTISGVFEGGRWGQTLPPPRIFRPRQFLYK
jgi:hypothetical protein